MTKEKPHEDLILATRGSALALKQAQLAARLIEAHGYLTQINSYTTTGDKILDKKLSSLTDESLTSKQTVGKGFFIKEVEEALLNKKAQIAVHSFKDFPVDNSSKFFIPTLLKRGSCRDVIVLSSDLFHYINAKKSLSSLTVFELFEHLASYFLTHKKSTIGTASLRRELLLKHYLPEAKVKFLRGNILTRINKLNDGEYSAIILAEAGLERLHLFENCHSYPLDPKIFVPAPAQGVIALETLCENEELINNLSQLNHTDTLKSTCLERLSLKVLNGGCHSALSLCFLDDVLYAVTGNKDEFLTAKIKIKSEHHEIFKESLNKNKSYTSLFHSLSQSSLSSYLRDEFISHGFDKIFSMRRL